MRFLNISCKAETHTIPKPRAELIPCYETSIGKHSQFPVSDLPYRFRANGKACNSQCLEMSKFSYHRNMLRKPYHSKPLRSCGFVRKLELIRKLKQSPENQTSNISYYENTKGKTIQPHAMGLDQKLIELDNPHNSQIWDTRFSNLWE